MFKYTLRGENNVDKPLCTDKKDIYITGSSSGVKKAFWQDELRGVCLFMTLYASS
jgi:hypothetical protein